jgi:regulator of replication initiation timing
MQEELDALQAQIRSLRALVSELLLINQKLRLEVEELKHDRGPSASTAHLTSQHR